MPIPEPKARSGFVSFCFGLGDDAGAVFKTQVEFCSQALVRLEPQPAQATYVNTQSIDSSSHLHVRWLAIGNGLLSELFLRAVESNRSRSKFVIPTSSGSTHIPGL